MRKKKSTNVSAFSVRFPNELIQEIDQICNLTLITRSSWLIAAAREKLTKERMKGREELISKIASQES